MRGKNSDMGLIMESMQYLLMKHYGLSMSDLKQLDEVLGEALNRLKEC